MHNWMEKFIESLKGILDKPPYLIITFVSSVLIIVSISVNRYFDQIFAIFLYSIIGTVWRYIEKDLDAGINKFIYKNDERESKRNPTANLIIIVIYHFVNILLLIALILYLGQLSS